MWSVEENTDHGVLLFWNTRQGGERLNKGHPDNLYYWRDKTGNEVDILIDNAGKLTAMELKAGETISQDFFKGLNYFSSLNKKTTGKILVYGGKAMQKRSDNTLVKPWYELT